MRRLFFVLLTLLLVPMLHAQTTSNAALMRQVFAAESTFAASMANRDTAAFARFVSAEAYSRDGKQSGTFSSIWRREPDGAWRVILDKGCQVCNCEKKAT